MLRTLTIQGFKSIANLELELGRVNCLIGANGVGKSNVLEALGVASRVIIFPFVAGHSSWQES